MIRPNPSWCVLQRATTQFGWDRLSEAHTDDDLQLGRVPEQTLVVAAMGYMILPQRTSSGSLP